MMWPKLAVVADGVEVWWEKTAAGVRMEVHVEPWRWLEQRTDLLC